MEPVDASVVEARSTCLEGALGASVAMCIADRSMDSSRRNPQGCMEENSNATGAGDPILMEDAGCRIDAASSTESICRS